MHAGYDWLTTADSDRAVGPLLCSSSAVRALYQAQDTVPSSADFLTFSQISAGFTPSLEFDSVLRCDVTDRVTRNVDAPNLKNREKVELAG